MTANNKLRLIFIAIAFAHCNVCTQLSAEDDSPIRHHGVSVLALSSDGSLLASAGNGEIRLWDLRSGGLLWRVKGHEYSPIRLEGGPSGPVDGTTGLAFIQDDSLLVSAGKDGNIRITSIETRQTVRTIAEPWVYSALDPSSFGIRAYLRVPIDGFSISHDESLIAAVVFGTVQVWRISDGASIASFGMEQLQEVEMSLDTFTPNGWAGDINQFRLKFFGGRLGFPENLIDELVTVSCWQANSPVFDDLKSIEISNDDSFLAANGSRGSYILSLPRLELQHTVTDASWVAFQPDNASFSCGTRFSSIRVRELESGSLIRSVEGVITNIVTSNGTHELLSNSQGRLRLWNTESWEPEDIPMEVDGKGLNTYAISANGRFVAARWHEWDKGLVRIFDRVGNTEIRCMAQNE